MSTVQVFSRGRKDVEDNPRCGRRKSAQFTAKEPPNDRITVREINANEESARSKNTEVLGTQNIANILCTKIGIIRKNSFYWMPAKILCKQLMVKLATIGILFPKFKWKL